MAGRSGTIITRKGIRYFSFGHLHDGDTYVYARRIEKEGLSKNVVRVWLKGARLRYGEFKPKAELVREKNILAKAQRNKRAKR